MKIRCEWCKKKIAPCGMPMHVSAKHRGMVLSRFRCDPLVRLHMFVEYQRFPEEQLMLPAPNPLTVYSRRPMGFMAAPIPEHRRPKGYELGYGYGRPVDLLRAQVRYGYIFT